MEAWWRKWFRLAGTEKKWHSNRKQNVESCTDLNFTNSPASEIETMEWSKFNGMLETNQPENKTERERERERENEREREWERGSEGANTKMVDRKFTYPSDETIGRQLTVRDAEVVTRWTND